MSLRDSILQTGLIRGLVDFVFPPLCLGCSGYTDNQRAICEDCFQRIDRFSYPICLRCFRMLPKDGPCPECEEKSLPLFAFGNYTVPLRDIVIQFKFKGIRSIATTFAEELVSQFGNRLARYHAARLIPIPLHSQRESFRGYNQALVLAQRLSMLLNIPLADDMLRRMKKRRPQADLNFEKRAQNIKGVFRVSQPAEEAQRIILVDDVVTTGSTVMESSSRIALVARSSASCTKPLFVEFGKSDCHE